MDILHTRKTSYYTYGYFINMICMNIEEYFENFSHSIWQKRAKASLDKINKLKRNKSKVDYVNDLYSTYLQLIENFIILLLVRWMNNTIFLFKDTRETSQYFKENKNHLIQWLLKEILLCVPKDHYSKTQKRYEKLLEEVFKDYSQDKSFLNSYKHWYRLLKNWFDASLQIKRTGLESDFIEIAKTSHTISYLGLKKDHKNKTTYVYENQISFDPNYIYWKIYFITDIIEKIIFLYKREWKIQINYLTLDNEWYLEKKNSFRFSNPKWIIK